MSNDSKNTSSTRLKKDSIIAVLLGIIIVVIFAFLRIINYEPIESWIKDVENFVYDAHVRQLHKPLSEDIPIAIIDIDDKSIEEKGRWPWSRKLVSELIDKLFQAGATVVALDITFPDPEENRAVEVIKELKKDGTSETEVLKALEAEIPTFDYDEQLAKSLQKGESVLGFIFTDEEQKNGVLPDPFIHLSPELTEEIAIPNHLFYLANIETLQKAAKHGGFINATPDSDGVLRYTPLLFRRDSNVYASLSLQAVSLYLLANDVALVTDTYGDSTVLEGVKLDQAFIPTDETGRILIPFRGVPFSFKYIPAIDVLDNKILKESIEGKLIFVGFSAKALSDNYPTPESSIFPGVEIHATIASGILDNYLPYNPYWVKGVTTFLITVVGLFFALILPFVGAFLGTLLSVIFTVGLFFGKEFLWVSSGIVIPVILPMILIIILYLFNVSLGYFTAARRGKELKSMFGQYVPPDYLEKLMKKGGEINLEGESKEISVLFSDIRGFTQLSEKMTAHELKQFLNDFFNPITEVIFNNKGTIDKYVGDMVMAFWGAPLDNPRHAYLAVKTGLEMQKRLAELNVTFIQENKPLVKIGVGINTDIINVGDMGSKYRRCYTVIGDAVNLASRLEGQGKYYFINIMVGEKTWLQTNKDFAYKKIDRLKVKGKDTAVVVYQPICPIQDATPEILQEIELHHQALEAYFQQRWDFAESTFKQLKVTYPKNEGLYIVFLERIEKLRTMNLEPNWDGAYVSHEK